MSFCTTEILQLADAIYQSVNSPESQSIGFVSGWLTSPSNLATLNTRLTTCFSFTGAGPCIAGGFGQNEAFIYSLMFQTEYYRRKAQEALSCGSSWTSIREGDTALSRDSNVKVSAGWKDLKKETEQDLSVAVANWKLGHTLARSVDAAPMASYPTP